ncbi:MAG: helix-turn-helix domain-containing protein [Vulcanimicrobiota bacterium]
MSFHEQHVEHTPGSLLTLDEAAQRLNVETTDVRQMISNNQLPGYEVAGEWRVDVAEVDQMASSEKQMAAIQGSHELADGPRPGI